MGLMTILRKVKMQERELRVLLLGLDNAGKTTLVKRLNGMDVHSVSPTLGFDISSMQYGDYTLNIWDVGGQQTIRAYWRNYFEATDAIVWVVDSADALRLTDCRAELQTVLNEERLAGATLLVLANKQDLPGALEPDKIADILNLRGSVGRTRHWRIFGCSAMQGHVSDPAVDGTAASDDDDVVYKLADAVEWLVGDVSSRVFLSQ